MMLGQDSHEGAQESHEGRGGLPLLSQYNSELQLLCVSETNGIAIFCGALPSRCARSREPGSGDSLFRAALRLLPLTNLLDPNSI
jgi:hypothetical protein